jgi:hypothetical protein
MRTGRKILKNAPQGASVEGSDFIFNPNSYFWGDLKLHAKFHNSTTTPPGRKIYGTDRAAQKG